MHMSKETNTRHFNIESLQPLGVGWLQLLLILNMGSFYTEKWIEKYSISQQRMLYAEVLKWIILPSAFCQGYKIADCHVFS